MLVVKGQYTLLCMVPTAHGKPGKMTTVFPVLEKYWNFIILSKILENELSGEKIVFKLIVGTFMLLHLKKGDRTSAISCPQCV